jgi:putative tricarboxylic transport membrane protein
MGCKFTCASIFIKGRRFNLKKWKPGLWAGIFLLIFSLVFLMQSLSFPFSIAGEPGPGFFPVWLSGILLILSFIYIYQSIKSKDVEGEPLPKGKALKKIVFILSYMILYMMVVSFLGFILASTMFLFVLLCRDYKWYLNLGISAGASIFLFLLFHSVLNVSLPINGFGW